MHPPIGGGVSTDFKSLNRIKISRLVQILLHFYWFGVPHSPGGGRRVGWVSEELEIMWGPSRWFGDDGDDTGMTWGQQGQSGDHGDHRDNMGWRPRRQQRPWRPQTMGTTWGPSGGYGDDMGMMGMTRVRRGDDGDNVGTMWGQRGDHRDNKITKNAITFKRIKIIEFRLKIWDPWTLPHTCRLQLMCRWGGVLSQMAFLSKKCSSDPGKIFFPIFALDPIRPYLDWALRGFLTSWPIYDPLKLQPKWKQSAKFD